MQRSESKFIRKLFPEGNVPIAGLVGVMNIINGIAIGVSPCVLAPPSLAAEEQMLWERSTYESGMR